MKLEAGKTYKARNGKVYGPLVAIYSTSDENKIVGFIDPNKREFFAGELQLARFDFYPNGQFNYMGTDPRDLIEEINDGCTPSKMNGSYEFNMSRSTGEYFLYDNTARELARFSLNPIGLHLFNVAKQQIKQDGGKLLNLDRGEWVI